MAFRTNHGKEDNDSQVKFMTLLEKSGLDNEVIESNTLVDVRTYHL